MDRLSAKVGETEAILLLNVISLESAGFASPDSVEGALSWRTLAQAEIRYDAEGELRAGFPEALRKLDDTTVKLAGYMLPLEPETQQKHFLLTSFPPSCFFHIPGGPSGAVEVFSEEGVESSWDLLVLEGRLKMLSSSEFGVVYQLLEAKITPQ